MTVLAVAAAGRRRYVIENLLRAARPADTLVVLDSDPHAPALNVRGAVPSVPSGRGIDALLASMLKHEVDAVVSLHDYQSIDLARSSRQLASKGIEFIGPRLHTAQICLDKVLLSGYLSAHAPGAGIDTFTPTEMPPSLSGPLVLKDRYGSGSSGLRIVADAKAAMKVAQEREAQSFGDPSGEIHGSATVIQPLVEGSEYNIDLFYDRSGHLSGHCLKQKRTMRNGETDIAHVMIEDRFSIVNRLVSALDNLDFVGNVDVDVMQNDGELKVLDVNPRLGGGYAFSSLAGYEAALGLWSLARGEALEVYLSAKRELYAAKYVGVTEILGVEATA